MRLIGCPFCGGLRAKSDLEGRDLCQNGVNARKHVDFKMLNEPIAIALMEIVGGVEAIKYHDGCRNMSAAIDGFQDGRALRRCS